MLEGIRGRWLRFCIQYIKIQHGGSNMVDLCRTIQHLVTEIGLEVITCAFARSLIINQWSDDQNKRKQTEYALDY